MTSIHTITTDVLNPVVPVEPAEFTPPVFTHVCVGTDGSYYCRDTLGQLIDFGFKPGPHATVRLRAGETMEEAAYRHTRAEQRYFASL